MYKNFSPRKWVSMESTSSKPIPLDARVLMVINAAGVVKKLDLIKQFNQGEREWDKSLTEMNEILYTLAMNEKVRIDHKGDDTFVYSNELYTHIEKGTLQ